MSQIYEQIISHLRQNQPTQALDLIDSNIWNEQDIHIISWRSQALMQLHHYQKALKEIIRGIRLAKQIKNKQAEDALRKIQRECTDKLIVMKSAQSSDGPLSEPLKLIKSGQTQPALELLYSLREKADKDEDIKMQVLVRLALAEIETERQQAFDEAAKIADDTNDQNLIAAVVRAKKLHGVVIKPHIF